MFDTPGARRWWSVVPMLVVAPWLSAAEGAVATGGLGAPLILQDGRIADVSVVTLPFALGEASLAPDAAEALRARIEPLTTDCFLAAQVIGHVRPGSQADGDTLAAHRLARHRAEHVQSLLIEAGLPTDFVTTAWDWQFLLSESRVTLWLFNLASEDDCAGAPLHASDTSRPASPPVPAGEAQHADVEAPPPPLELVESVEAVENAESAEDVELAEDMESVEEIEQAAETADTGEIETAEEEVEDAEPTEDMEPIEEIEQTAEAANTGEIETAEEEAEGAAPDDTTSVVPEPIEVEIVAVVEELSEPIETSEPLPEMLVAEPEEVVASLPSENEEPAGDEEPATEEPALAELVIVFDLNSSFFPPETAAGLRHFVDALPGDTEIVVDLAAAVGTGRVRGADAAGSESYNRWMAERRMERVATWLAQRARDRRLVIEERFVEDDDSRSVTLLARPPS